MHVSTPSHPPPPPFTSSSITIQTTSVALQFSVRSSQVWLSSPMTSTVREGSQPWCTADLLHSSRSQRKKISTWKIVPVSSVVHFTSPALKHVRHSKESESTIKYFLYNSIRAVRNFSRPSNLKNIYSIQPCTFVIKQLISYLNI